MLSAKIYFIFATLFLAFFFVDYASADRKSEDQQYLSPFLGKNYQHTTSDSKYVDFLKFLKASKDEIKQALAAHPLVMLTFNANNGYYTLKRNGGGFGDFTQMFKLRQTFSTKFIKRNTEVTFTQNINSLTQLCRWDNGKNSATVCTYIFNTEELTVECRVGQIETVQTFILKR